MRLHKYELQFSKIKVLISVLKAIPTNSKNIHLYLGLVLGNHPYSNIKPNQRAQNSDCLKHTLDDKMMLKYLNQDKKNIQIT